MCNTEQPSTHGHVGAGARGAGTGTAPAAAWGPAWPGVTQLSHTTTIHSSGTTLKGHRAVGWDSLGATAQWSQHRLAMDTELPRGTDGHRSQQRDSGTPKLQSNPHLIQWHYLCFQTPSVTLTLHLVIPLSLPNLSHTQELRFYHPSYSGRQSWMSTWCFIKAMGRDFSLFPSWPVVPLPAQPQSCPQAFLPWQLSELTHKTATYLSRSMSSAL